MDTQGLEKALFFPTLGVGIEEVLKHDPDACHAAFRAFNRWLEDDWGFAYQERLRHALHHADRRRPGCRGTRLPARARCARDRDARGAGRVPDRSCSPADPRFDPFWARVNEAGITVTGQGAIGQNSVWEAWGEGGKAEAFAPRPSSC